MSAAETWTIIGALGGCSSIGGVIVFLLRPLRTLAGDLAPLTDKNSDGHSVFTDMRAQLQQLVDEFPKNGVPARTAFDAVKLDVARLVAELPELKAELADVKASQQAHVQMHRIPRQR